MRGNWVRWIGIAAAGLFVLLQAVPYGRAHTNPPVTAEPAWDRPETRALAVRACYDCHSNETRWPWYSHIAPVSWLVQKDVDRGRAVLNFSEWSRPQPEAHGAAESVREGEMPPRIYLVTHPAARLSPAERWTLVRGLTATLGGEGHRESQEREDD